MVAAGPLANFVLAILIFSFIYMFAGKDFTPAQIQEVQKDGPAYSSGIKTGDIILSINNKNYVFDAGSRSTANFISQGTLEAAFIEAIFITHTHSDHIGSLGELVLASWGRGRTSSLPVYGAGKEIQNVVDGFNLAYLPDREHRTIHHGEEFFKPENGLLVAKIFKMPNPERLVFEDNNIKVFAFTVPHGPIHGAVGYRIIADDRSVVISGDTDVMKDYNFLNGVDVLIHEAIIEKISTEVSQSAYRLGNDRIGEIFMDINDYHANLIDYDNNPGLLSRLEEIDLGILANRVKPKKLVLSHILFWGASEESLMDDIKKNFNGEAIIAKDLLVID